MAKQTTKPVGKKAVTLKTVTAKTGDKPKTSKAAVATTAKRPAAKKPTVKKLAVKKPAVKKPLTNTIAKKSKPAVKQKTAVKPTLEERYRMVELAAYYIAEQNGFQGRTDEYWAAAENQIATRLDL